MTVTPTIIDICTGAGLFSRAFKDAGCIVIPGPEILEEMALMYQALNGHMPRVMDMRQPEDLFAEFGSGSFDGMIGGPPCQSRSKLKSMRTPKFPDLTEHVARYLDHFQPDWYLFENVGPLDIPGACHVKMDAMHYAFPHQSRPRWFTYSPNITPPKQKFVGTVDDLMAYPIVAGRIYGPIRGSRLQGYPDFIYIRKEDGSPFRCSSLQLGLANGVTYGMGLAWANSITGR